MIDRAVIVRGSWAFALAALPSRVVNAMSGKIVP
jgi:hypothetical protein